MAAPLAILVSIPLSLPPVIEGQTPANGSQGGTPAWTGATPTVLRLLRQPDGLRKAAKLYGKVVLHRGGMGFIGYDVAGLVRESSVIVVGTLTSSQSRLGRMVNDGDDIFTDCTIHVDQVLKGSASGDVAFRVEGGLVQFPDGTSAEIITGQWKSLRAGERYVVMLRRDPDTGEYVPTGDVEGLFHILPGSGAIDPLATKDENTHAISHETNGISSASFFARIRQLQSQN